MGGGGVRRATPCSEIAGVKFFSRAVDGVDDEGSEIARRRGQAELGSGVVAIVGGRRTAGRLVVGGHRRPHRRDSTRSISCALAAEKLGGKGGGGRPDMAQAGGPDGAAAEAALDAVAIALEQRAGA